MRWLSDLASRQPGLTLLQARLLFVVFSLLVFLYKNKRVAPKTVGHTTHVAYTIWLLRPKNLDVPNSKIVLSAPTMGCRFIKLGHLHFKNIITSAFHAYISTRVIWLIALNNIFDEPAFLVCTLSLPASYRRRTFTASATRRWGYSKLHNFHWITCTQAHSPMFKRGDGESCFHNKNAIF